MNPSEKKRRNAAPSSKRLRDEEDEREGKMEKKKPRREGEREVVGRQADAQNRPGRVTAVDYLRYLAPETASASGAQLAMEPMPPPSGEEGSLGVLGGGLYFVTSPRQMARALPRLPSRSNVCCSLAVRFSNTSFELSQVAYCEREL